MGIEPPMAGFCGDHYRGRRDPDRVAAFEEEAWAMSGELQRSEGEVAMELPCCLMAMAVDAASNDRRLLTVQPAGGTGKHRVTFGPKAPRP